MWVLVALGCLCRSSHGQGSRCSAFRTPDQRECHRIAGSFLAGFVAPRYKKLRLIFQCAEGCSGSVQACSWHCSWGSGNQAPDCPAGTISHQGQLLTSPPAHRFIMDSTATEPQPKGAKKERNPRAPWESHRGEGRKSYRPTGLLWGCWVQRDTSMSWEGTWAVAPPACPPAAWATS